MSNFRLVIFALVLIGLAFSKPWDPEPRTEEWWHARHQQFLNTSRSRGDDIKIVFTGSSSIEYWNTNGREIWDAKYAPLGAVNYGIGGDRTEHVLWRVAEGELDGLNPKLVVVYIGSNNVPGNSNNSEIVRGVDTVVTKIHEKVPNSNILLVGFFPRGDVRPVNNTLARIIDISAQLTSLVDGDNGRKSHFLDIFDSLALPSLDGIREEYYRGDKLHLNPTGYVLWDRLMNSTFYDLIN